MSSGSTNLQYPTNIDTFITFEDDIDTIPDSSVNDCHTAILSIENELGTEPKGSTSSVKARLAVSLNNDGTIKSSAVQHSISSTGYHTSTVVLNYIFKADSNGLPSSCVFLYENGSGIGIGTTNPQDYLHVQGNIRGNTLILSKTSGEGIKVDVASPTFGWRDLKGIITIRGIGSTDPSFNIYRNGIRQHQFSVNDEVFLEFHIDHDYVPNTHIYIHPHWSHNSSLVTGGSVTWTAEMTYSKGHNQAAFPATVSLDITQNASTTQYQHLVADEQASVTDGDSTHLNTTNLEIDGIILVRFYLKANNITVSGGGAPEPFLHYVDIHYQSTNVCTKQRAPNFYT